MPENENKQGKAHMGDNVSMRGRIHVRGETHENEEDPCEREAVERQAQGAAHMGKGHRERKRVWETCKRESVRKKAGSEEEGKRQSIRRAKQTQIPISGGRKRTCQDGSKRKIK